MNDPAAPAPDRGNLEIDLAKSFLPAWAREGDDRDSGSKLAERFGGAHDRPDRGHRGEFQRDSRKPNRQNREDRPQNRPRRDDRPRDGKGRRDEALYHSPRREERDRPAPIEPVTGWEVRFLPDRTGVDGLARQIKSSMKAYPLFDLARLVLEKSERYQVELKRTSEDAQALFQFKPDGSLWLDEASAASHALGTQLESLYRRERVSIEAPKGSFPCVAQCGLSGVLLGPPNYHGYQSKLREVHAQKFPNMPFDAYAARVRTVKDEELIEQWKQEQCFRDEFVPITDEAPQPIEPAPETEPIASTEPAEPAESAESAESTESTEPTEPTESTESTEIEVAESAPEPEKLAVRLKDMREVEAHFLANHAGTSIVKIRERVIAPGSSAMNSSAPAVLALTRACWAELDRFPLPLAHSLSKQLSGKGLHAFKAKENVTFIGVARPHYLDIDSNPVSDAVRDTIDYIRRHSAQPRHEQWKGLIALRPVASPEEEPARDAAVAADLSWLLHAGHLVDFAGRGLGLAPRQNFKPERK